MKTKQALLREKQATATRDYILSAALELLVEHPDSPFSHEAVAKAAGVGARTVYRYFPAQADLYEALWLRVREHSGTVFPRAEAEIVPILAKLYRAFDRNEKLVRAVMESPAGARVRARGAVESRSCFDRSLHDLMAGRSAIERRKIRAVFQGLHSGLFWQMLRDRGELSGAEAIAAAGWAATALMNALRRKQGTAQRKKNNGKMKERSER